jgi:hypothetical protein
VLHDRTQVEEIAAPTRGELNNGEYHYRESSGENFEVSNQDLVDFESPSMDEDLEDE